MYPTLTKPNMRYRGPMESNKINRTESAKIYDVYIAGYKIDQLQAGLSALRQAAVQGSDASWTVDNLPKTILGSLSLCQAIQTLEQGIRDLQGGA